MSSRNNTTYGVAYNDPKSLFSHSFAHGCLNVDAYTFFGDVPSKYAQAIIDTVCYLGYMQMKDSEHSASGQNAQATKRILKEAIETRKAADVLLASGAITLMGTWSNGIQVGPGEGFAHIAQSAPVAAAAPVKAARKPRTYADGLDKQWHDTARRYPAIVEHGATCDMCYADGACCPVSFGKAVASVVGDLSAQEAITHRKPRVRLTLAQMRAAAMPAHDDADALVDATITAITGEEYSETAITPAPVPTPIYEPAAGETVHFMLAHENGTTTERVVIVHRVRRDAAGNVDLVRGFDIRRNKTRNFAMARVQWMRQWDGKEIADMAGRVLVPAA
jgi:hypothetical protein